MLIDSFDILRSSVVCVVSTLSGFEFLEALSYSLKCAFHLFICSSTVDIKNSFNAILYSNLQINCQFNKSIFSIKRASLKLLVNFLYFYFRDGIS